MSDQKKTICIIGCGMAGGIVALELLKKKYNIIIIDSDRLQKSYKKIGPYKKFNFFNSGKSINKSRGLNARLQSLYNSYGFDEYNFVLKKNSIILDIGANIGEFSIYCARNKHHVFAIELDVAAYNLLIKNSNNYSNIKCFNLAISNFIGSQYIYSSTLTASTSIIKPNDNNTNREAISVRGLTLDDFIEKNDIKRIDFLKADCEGAEPEMLEGLTKYRNIIKYFSIDCGAERNGKFTYKEVINSLLKNKNFQLLSKPAYEIKNRVIVKNNNFI